MAARLDEFHYRPPSPVAAWVETVVGTLIVPAIGLLFHRSDFLFLQSQFSWLVFAPLLFGVRYGFAFGFTSGLMTVLLMLIEHAWTPAAAATFPYQYALCALLVGMIGGQFADVWLRRLARMQLFNDHVGEELTTFASSYQMLKLSHGRLEERLADDAYSLRGAFEALKWRIASGRVDDPEFLHHHAQAFLDFLATHCRLQGALLYEIHDDMADLPSATLGDGHVTVRPDHPMIRDCLASGKVVALRAENISQVEGRVQQDGLLAVVPLIDVHGAIHAVVVVTDMPFIAFNDQNLDMLGVLAAGMANFAHPRTQPSKARFGEGDQEGFHDRVALWSTYVARYHIDTMLVGIQLAAAISRKGDVQAADQLVMGELRSLDAACVYRTSKGGVCVLVLMPMTSEYGAHKYVKRIQALMIRRFDLGFPAIDQQAKFLPLALDGSMEAAEAIERLCRECDVADA
ncbi:MAG: hypothetical protein EPN72_01410 [Nevskiaceae bacterium]|nr:MAG: hypothetical protein EPN63_12160 [Nevskiaceae bacterium]TBR74709.1 MAG: hypothetical protein EPN72_01410 [Nevskiaceae bacterium]